MRYAFFTIPIHNPQNATAEMNQFLAAHKVISQDQQFVQDGPNSAWVFCVRYQGGEEAPGQGAGKGGGKADRIDYKEILPPEEFAVYARLRDLRKEMSDREGVPPFALFSNQQLAEMVRRQVASLEAMREIAGIGDGRAEKYGAAFLEVLRRSFGGGE